MANTLFDAARKRFLEGQINWMTDTIKLFPVSTGINRSYNFTHARARTVPRKYGD